MKFGKLENIEGVDFSLPPDHPDTLHVLQEGRRPPGTQLHIYMGCTGWGNQEWVGKWYPTGAKSGDFLKHYTHQFNTIELNTTYYRTPDRFTIERWLQNTSPGFKFCPKIPQGISHRRYLLHAEEETLAFCKAVSGLGYHLGPSFLQLPPNFGSGQFARLENYIAAFPKEVPLHFEFRHTSWFEDTPLVDEAFQAMIKEKSGTVLTDVAGRRDVLHMRLTTPVLMLRFVGNGLHPTDYSRIDEWVDRLKKWNDLGLREAYFFLHEPETIDVPDLAIYLADKIREKLNISVKPPHPAGGPVQGTLF